MGIKFENNPKILNDFLYYLLGGKGYSTQTLKDYNGDLMIFFQFLKEYIDIPIEVKDFNVFILMQVKEADVDAFLVYLNYTRDNSPYTRQRRLSAIRRFYKWLMYIYPEKIKKNPTANIKNIVKVERLPKYLSLEQAKKIQDIFTLANSKFPFRNNAIISLFLSTGMRISELVNVNIENIDFKNKSILIHGKGNKERYVYINKHCMEQLQKYIDYRKRYEKKEELSGALFINYQKKRIGIDGVENVCSKAYKLMGLEEFGYTAHTLRHTAATIMYKYVQPDIKLIKEFLGHSSIVSTEIYTHVYNEEIKNATDRNPLNNEAINKNLKGKRG